MATGRVIVWKEEREKTDRYFGFIVDAAFGDDCPKEASVHFDERCLACDPSEMAPRTLVSFDYDSRPPAPGRNPRARNVRPLPMPVKIGEVVKIRPNDFGFYGFLHADGDAQDYYFTDRTLTAGRRDPRRDARSVLAR
ncbi:hypothetical protein AB8Z38_22980 [Bradyrhizobium sp. LLZ17]|uniref:CSD domain-containing protein n=1 Tax=Bradyrhizobium sp. LLZ17 TaxID=3239388 RepID=A0AB39XFS0_9BRAD